MDPASYIINFLCHSIAGGLIDAAEFTDTDPGFQKV